MTNWRDTGDEMSSVVPEVSELPIAPIEVLAVTPKPPSRCSNQSQPAFAQAIDQLTAEFSQLTAANQALEQENAQLRHSLLENKNRNWAATKSASSDDQAKDNVWNAAAKSNGVAPRPTGSSTRTTYKQGSFEQIDTTSGQGVRLSTWLKKARARWNISDDVEKVQGLNKIEDSFRELCEEHSRTISAKELVDMFAIQNLDVEPLTDLDERIMRYALAVQALNKTIFVTDGRGGDDMPPDAVVEIHESTFLHIMRKTPEVWATLDEDRVEDLQEIRQIIIREQSMREIANLTGIDRAKIVAPKKLTLSERVLQFLDGAAAVLIVLNALTLSMSLDIAEQWPGWTFIELFFIVCFSMEIGARISIEGCRVHLRGQFKYWNIFDITVVSFGLVDAVLSTMHMAEIGAKEMVVVRVLRLLRLVKLIRVLRLKAFKELRLMANGLFLGLRTLFWAFVFLCFFIFLLGVFAKRLFAGGPPPAALLADVSKRRVPGHVPIAAEYNLLFGTLAKSMFTVFRCTLSPDCSTSKGSSVILLIWENHGILYILAYVVCFVFLTFGLFNLIMAIIVESTVLAGKRDETRRRHARHNAHLEVAQKVHKLVNLLCQAETLPTQSNRSSASRQTSSGRGTYSSWNPFKPDPRSRQEPCLPRLHAQISIHQLRAVLEKPAIADLLEELDINVVENAQVVDCLDVNANGKLDIRELVKGLMKLRGQVEKSDVVASWLLTRRILKGVQLIESNLMHQVGREAFQHGGQDWESRMQPPAWLPQATQLQGLPAQPPDLEKKEPMPLCL